MHKAWWWENLRDGYSLRDLCLGVKLKLMSHIAVERECVDWIERDGEKIQWWTFVNTAMNLGFLKSRTFLDQLI
jgi:hypothetical protein